MGVKKFKKTLSIPHYLQSDKRWGEKPLYNGEYIEDNIVSYIKDIGCCLTSYAMVLGVTPLTLYEEANMKDELADWTKAENYSGKTFSRFYSFSLSKIFRYLFHEQVGVVVEVPGHFVVVNGFEGTLTVDPDEVPMSGYKASMFNVLDPASSNSKTLQDYGEIISLRVFI